MDRQDEILLMLGEVRADVKTLLKSDEDQEERLRSLEQSAWKKSGIMGAIGAIIGFIGAFFGKG